VTNRERGTGNQDRVDRSFHPTLYFLSSTHAWSISPLPFHSSAIVTAHWWPVKTSGAYSAHTTQINNGTSFRFCQLTNVVICMRLEWKRLFGKHLKIFEIFWRGLVSADARGRFILGLRPDLGGEAGVVKTWS